MSKPVTYWIQTDLIEQLCEAWGGQFQELNTSEKLWMLYILAGQLVAEPSDFYDPNNIDPVVEAALERCQQELEPGNKLSLIEALTNQLRM